MAKVEIVSSTLVPMAMVDPTQMSRLDLTPWDLQWLLLEPIQYGVLFHKPSFPMTIIIEYLEASFSRLLDYFPPLAGRLTAEKLDGKGDRVVYYVDCNNRGAGFSHAVALDLSVSDVSEAKYTPEVVYSLFPLDGTRNIEGTSEPLLAVQITEIRDGVFFGCAINHAVVDGTSLHHLVLSASEICRGMEKISIKPVFDRDFSGVSDIPRGIPVPAIEEDKLPKLVWPVLLDRVFHLSKESIAKLKARSNTEAGGGDMGFSSFQVIVAHLWRCVVRCRRRIKAGDGGGVGKKEALMTAIGARGRIPLPEGYFGNAIYCPTLWMSEEELLGDGLGRAAAGLKTFVGRRVTAEAVAGFLGDWVEQPLLLGGGRSYSLGVSSFPKFDAYGGAVDFGLGRPVLVRTGKAQKWDGKVTLFTAAEGDGVDVELCLAPKVMEALEEDGEFRDAV